MQQSQVGYVPIITSVAGSCLTTLNWQEANISIGSYYLRDLLIKPGFENLLRLTDLAVNSTGKCILNASMPQADKDGNYVLRSEYDGSSSRYSLEDLFVVIRALHPNIVVLPHAVQLEDIQHSLFLPASIMPIFTNDKFCSKSELVPLLISGDYTPQLIAEKYAIGIKYIETDRPAVDGMEGRFYSVQGMINITDKDNQLAFDLLDANCSCPVCTQKLSRAYLHHLFTHTPLLCHRYLIQHNVYYVNNIQAIAFTDEFKSE